MRKIILFLLVITMLISSNCVLFANAEDSNNLEVASVNSPSASDLTISSPDASITVQFALSSSGGLSYSVTKNGDTILEASAMGITTSLADFSSGLTLESTQLITFDQTYTTPQHKSSQYRDYFNQREIVTTKNNQTMKIYMRVYNDGIAYRYYIPGTGTATISAETSEFNLPENTGGWAFDWRSDYEGLYTYRSPSDFTSANFAMPVLASISNNKYWLLLTEGNVYNADGSYCSSHLDGSSGEVLKLAFAPEQTSDIVSTYPFQTPYRVAIITDNLNDLVNSTLVTNLNPQSEISDTSWLEPGKAAWSWWSEERSPQWYQRQLEYVEFAAENGWEYVTVDAGWDASWVALLCSKASALDVGIIVWTDVDAIDTSEEINQKLTQWAAWGVKGIKVDFMMNDSQSRMKTYEMIAEKAAELQMLVNFHGSTKPSGESRTWPNIITSEGVRGTEHFKWGDYSTAYQNSTLPFTRNVVGGMDYTPVVISNSTLNTTHAHQLALSVIYESGMQHFADSINTYEAWTGLPFLNKVPVCWDETHLLDGFPGNYAVMARRSGEEWFVGAITDASRTISIDCDFLGSGTYTAYLYTDGSNQYEIVTSTQSVTADSVLSINLSSTGGCTILITKEPFDNTLARDSSYTYYEAEASSNTLTGQASVVTEGNSFGDKKIGNLGGSAGSSLQFNGITVSEAGTYRLKLYYMSGDQRDVHVKVNGSAEEIVWELPATGSYHTMRCAYLDIELNSGSNTIWFGNTEYAPDIDCIGIKKVTAITYNSYEAENGSLSGAAYVSDESSFSNGKKVSYVGYTGEVLFSGINVSQSGTYVLRIYYGTADNRDLYVSANGGTPLVVNCFDSGGYGVLEYKEVIVSLQAGDNTLRLYHPSGYAPDLDRIEIMTTPVT